LILLDLALPGMDGWTFRRHQQGDPALAPIPVILVSGGGGLDRAAVSLAAAGYLPKPVEADHLLAAVRRFAGPPRSAILVVEDEPLVRKMLGLVLPHYGFAVLQADGGKEAVELFRQHRDVGVVLMDIQMPGLDGPQTLALLRQIDPKVRCVFMSGNIGDYTYEDLITLGASHVLSKPFASLDALAQTLYEVEGLKAG
jgi:CheY-like chemotaxis protein